eukprot:8965016-Ditylum_brightwellii.AAC.1
MSPRPTSLGPSPRSGASKDWLKFRKSVNKVKDTLNKYMYMFTVHMILNNKHNRHMTCKLRGVSSRNWISRGVMLNNYLEKLPTPSKVKARKADDEEHLEILENRVHTPWKYQIGK